MLGKEKCRILKEIRQRIADENDIPYVTRECGFQGECRGTCPRCESELRYLERELALRASLGKRVAVAALCATISLGASACSSPFGQSRELGGEALPADDLSGAVAYEPAETPEPDILMGEAVPCDEDPGDVLPPFWEIEEDRDIRNTQLEGFLEAWEPEENADG